MLTQKLKEQIKEHALKIPLEEICGLIGTSGDSLTYFPCKNISSNKQNHFELSCLDYLRISENNKIIGLVHSQKSSLPSPLDVVNSLGHNIKSFLYSIDEDIFVEVTDQHLKYSQFLSLPFEIGKNDCFSLVRAFYKKEYNIEIFNYFRDDNWYKENPNIMKESYKKEGFYEIDKKDLGVGDLLVFNFAHLGIYLEKDLFIHHQQDKLSNIERLDFPWINRLDLCLRHKNKI